MLANSRPLLTNCHTHHHNIYGTIDMHVPVLLSVCMFRTATGDHPVDISHDCMWQCHIQCTSVRSASWQSVYYSLHVVARVTYNFSLSLENALVTAGENTHVPANTLKASWPRITLISHLLPVPLWLSCLPFYFPFQAAPSSLPYFYITPFMRVTHCKN